MKTKSIVSLFVFAMIGSLLSCKSNDGQPVNEQNDDVALRQFVSESKEQAYQLIGKDSVAQGLDILISLWQEHHVDGMIPCGIGSAYYCMGDRDSAYYWFQVAEAYYDSMMVASPSEKYLRDKLPLAYILRGAEAAKEVEMQMSSESKKQASDFFEHFPTPEDFLENAVKRAFDGYKLTDEERKMLFSK